MIERDNQFCCHVGEVYYIHATFNDSTIEEIIIFFCQLTVWVEIRLIWFVTTVGSVGCPSVMMIIIGFISLNPMSASCISSRTLSSPAPSSVWPPCRSITQSHIHCIFVKVVFIYVQTNVTHLCGTSILRDMRVRVAELKCNLPNRPDCWDGFPPHLQSCMRLKRNLRVHPSRRSRRILCWRYSNCEWQLWLEWNALWAHKSFR